MFLCSPKAMARISRAISQCLLQSPNPAVHSSDVLELQLQRVACVNLVARAKDEDVLAQNIGQVHRGRR